MRFETSEPEWPDEAALTHYLAGEGSAEDRALVESWLGEDADNAARLERVRSAWAMAAQRVVRKDPARFVAEFRSKVREQGAGMESSERDTSRMQALNGKLPRGLSARHLIWLAPVIAVVWFNLQSVKAPVATPKTYTTVAGQRANITLADGSTVILAPATKLSVIGRAVELDGEAVFTVTQHTSESFTVKAGNTKTRVLGTTFGVRKYVTDKQVRVVVAEGKVSVGNTVLSIGDLAQIDMNGAVTQSRNADIASVIGWTQGVLVFRNTPVRKVLTEIERWYGLEFQSQLSKSILDRQINGTIESASGAALIPLISDLLGVSAEQRGRVVILEEK